MKTIIKWPLKAIWHRTLFLRRPLIHRVEALIARSVPRTKPCTINEETGLLMDMMVRELVRLQKQVDQMHQCLEDLTHARTNLGLVGDDGESRSAAG